MHFVPNLIQNMMINYIVKNIPGGEFLKSVNSKTYINTYIWFYTLENGNILVLFSNDKSNS